MERKALLMIAKTFFIGGVGFFYFYFLCYCLNPEFVKIPGFKSSCVMFSIGFYLLFQYLTREEPNNDSAVQGSVTRNGEED